MKTKMLTTVALVMAVSTLAISADEKRIPTLKAGKCEITLLDSNGITPLEGAQLELKQAEDGKTAVSAVASKSGLCEITVSEGRYVLTVDAEPITLLNASKDGEMAWARIVLSDSPMMLGGAVGASTATYTFMGFSGKAALATLVAAGTISAGTAAAIIKQSEDKRSERRRRRRQPQPSPSPSPSPTPRPNSN